MRNPRGRALDLGAGCGIQSVHLATHVDQVVATDLNPRACAMTALTAALNRGRPGMAAVDVYESEPVLPGQPLLRMENCLCTPHIGYVEEESYELYFNTAFDSVLGFIAGDPVNLVNPEVLRMTTRRG